MMPKAFRYSNPVTALFAAVLLTPLPALAADAQVYRCGDTYSQVPCGDNATQPKLYGARGAVETSALEKAKSCAASAVQQQQSEDGFDWQLLDASEAKPELININGAQVLGFRLTLVMAQVPIQGSAQGQRRPRQQFSCAVSQDFQRVLSLQALP